MEATELCYTPATQLAAAIRTKQVSPVEVVDAVLARIERLNPRLNAYCTVTADLARATARAAEAAVLRREALGPLHGVPYSLKDLTPTQGIRTTFGSKIFEHHVPTEDAILVERLRAAGGILLGKTNTPEFGCKGMTDNKIFGTTYNPWNLARTPGGLERRGRGGSRRWSGAAGRRQRPGRVDPDASELLWRGGVQTLARQDSALSQRQRLEYHEL